MIRPRSWRLSLAGVLVGLNPSSWQMAYHGHGEVNFSDRGVLLDPQTSVRANETHAALVLSDRKVPLKYFRAHIRYRNLKQNRAVDPHPWEVFWLMFNYRPGSRAAGGKKTNYLVVKPNGVEIGRAFGETGQKILQTWEAPTASIGPLHDLVLQRLGTKLVVEFDGHTIIYEFVKEKEKPFSHAGSIGLYTEDAKVLVESVDVTPL